MVSLTLIHWCTDTAVLTGKQLVARTEYSVIASPLSPSELHSVHTHTHTNTHALCSVHVCSSLHVNHS